MIAEYVREKIDRGEYSPGSTIKTERQYAKEFGLSQSKVHRELKNLVVEGYLESRRGSGYKVACREIKRTLCRVAFLSPLSDLSSGLGEEGTTFLLKAQSANIRLEIFSHAMQESACTVEKIMERIISEKQCAAVMINPATEHADYKKAVMMACNARLPLIWRDFNPTSFSLPGAGPNHSAIGTMAARILSAKGYKKTLFLGHSKVVGNVTFEAFSMMASELGLRYERLDYHTDNFPQTLAAKLKKNDFDSVFACTSYLSNIAYSCILNSGIDMPRKLGFLATRRTMFDAVYPVRKVDALVLDNELYADRLVHLMKTALRYPDAMETQIFTMLPKYVIGSTLR